MCVYAREPHGFGFFFKVWTCIFDDGSHNITVEGDYCSIVHFSFSSCCLIFLYSLPLNNHVKSVILQTKPSTVELLESLDKVSSDLSDPQTLWPYHRAVIIISTTAQAVFPPPPPLLSLKLSMLYCWLSSQSLSVSGDAIDRTICSLDCCGWP